MKLNQFWRWRDASHSFIDVDAVHDKNLLKDVKNMVYKFYPEVLMRKVFEEINRNLGSTFTNRQLSVALQTQIKTKFELTPVQMITLGFLCPDHEFQSQMLSFMY